MRHVERQPLIEQLRLLAHGAVTGAPGQADEVMPSQAEYTIVAVVHCPKQFETVQASEQRVPDGAG